MLLLCFLGLNGFFITWGFLQEQLMTQNYTLYGPDGHTVESVQMFPSITFLILSNRSLAILVATLARCYHRRNRSGNNSNDDESSGEKPKRTRFELTAVASVSNTLSSYFQYGALQYVSFPVQVLSKACKMIPNMAVGLLLGKKFQRYEYVMAITVSIGVVLFSYDQQFLTTGDADDAAAAVEEEDASDGGGLSAQTFGYGMIGLYLVFDALTSNWQSRLFRREKMDSYDMMLGVNCFSGLLTLSWLLIRNPAELAKSLDFVVQFPAVRLHLLGFGLCNSLGQLFIYYTISTYGALAFTMIMTTRQVFSIGFSVMVFGHAVGPVGVAGALVVFASLAYKIYAGQQTKNQVTKASGGDRTAIGRKDKQA